MRRLSFRRYDPEAVEAFAVAILPVDEHLDAGTAASKEACSATLEGGWAEASILCAASRIRLELASIALELVTVPREARDVARHYRQLVDENLSAVKDLHAAIDAEDLEAVVTAAECWVATDDHLLPLKRALLTLGQRYAGAVSP